MTGKDRTLEFHTITDAIKTKGVPVKQSSRSRKTNNKNHGEIVRKLASEISKETADTALKLKRTRKTCKKQNPRLEIPQPKLMNIHIL
jgi:hypothetical protein